MNKKNAPLKSLYNRDYIMPENSFIAYFRYYEATGLMVITIRKTGIQYKYEVNKSEANEVFKSTSKSAALKAIMARKTAEYHDRVEPQTIALITMRHQQFRHLAR